MAASTATSRSPGPTRSNRVAAACTVSCWGAHQDVPNIDYSKHGQTLVPTKLKLTGVLEVAAGGAHACARLDDDTVRCWGLDSDGQLGDGSHTYSAVPVTVIRTSRTGSK